MVYELLGTDWFNSAKNPSQPFSGKKYRLWSAHDATLGFLQAGLQLDIGGDFFVEPPFASHMEIELWQEKSTQLYSVKISYNGNYVKIPFCQDFSCDFVSWYKSLNTLDPKQWEAKCTQ